MKNISVKFGVFIITLLVLGSCMMPDLKPELYVGSYTTTTTTTTEEAVPTYPVFDFVIETLPGIFTPVGVGEPKLSLTWEPIPAGMTDAQLTAELEKAYSRWRMFERTIQPLPFYDDPISPTGIAPDRSGGGPSMNNRFVVFTLFNGDWVLDNSEPLRTGIIVIHRYWPKLKDLSGNPVALDGTVWRSPATLTLRQAAFKQAAAQIEAMAAAIAASPLSTKLPLQSLYDAMEELISHNPSLGNCAQRGGFSITQSGTKREAIFELSVSGPLYEYYLGYLPGVNDYSIPTGPFYWY